MQDALRQLVTDVNNTANFQQGLGMVVARVVLILDTEVCSIYLRDRTSDRFLLAASEGLNVDAIGRFSLGPHEGIVGLVSDRAEPINLADAVHHERYTFASEVGEEEYHGYLGVPIIQNRVVLGVIVVQGRETTRYEEEEVAFLATLAAQLARNVSHADAMGEISALVVGEVVRHDARFDGIAASPGVGTGTAYVVEALDLDSVPDKQVDDIRAELAIFESAISNVRADLERLADQMATSLRPEERELFDAYLHILDDAALAGDIRARIEGGQWAQGALREVISTIASSFERMADSYLRERAADVRDLGQRVLEYLQDVHHDDSTYPDDMVLVADEVTVTMLAEIPTENLRGIVSVKGSRYSHAGLLARALGIPSVMGVVDVPITIDGQYVIVDGNYGEIYLNPSDAVRDEFSKVVAEEAVLAEELETLRELPSRTRDGREVNLWVNIGLVSEISRSLDRGAEGIGLFRTEIPFSARDRFPTEAEQAIIYREHMEAFDPRPVTMRTLDIGGDKSLPYFPMVEEDNPFLGWRGIRVTLDHQDILLTQVRAMIKANAHLEGLLRIMLPMVSSVDEVMEARALIQRAYLEVNDEVSGVKAPEIGVMIEVPAAAYLTRDIAREVDFLAVGSNDLTQYMLAVDRNNARVGKLFQDMHPAVIRMLREIAKNCHMEGKAVGICGELAGTPEGALLCIGMGYDVLSMNATNLPLVKLIVRTVSLRRCRHVLAQVLKMNSSAEITRYVRDELVRAGLERVIPHHVVTDVFHRTARTELI